MFTPTHPWPDTFLCYYSVLGEKKKDPHDLSNSYCCSLILDFTPNCREQSLMFDLFPASIDRRKDYSDHEAFRLYRGWCEDVGRISVPADDQKQHLQHKYG